MNLFVKLAVILIFLALTNNTIGQKVYDGVGFETPASMMEQASEYIVSVGYRVIKYEIVESDYNPNLKLRRIEVNLSILKSNNKVIIHPSAIYFPIADNVVSGKAKDRIVILGRRNWSGRGDGPWKDAFWRNYGESIVALTGYSTMICPIPGEYEDVPGKEISIRLLIGLFNRTKDPVDHHYLRLAIPYNRLFY